MTTVNSQPANSEQLAASSAHESVSYPVNRIHEIGGSPQLFTQARHVRVHGSRIDSFLALPHVREQSLACLNAPVLFGEAREQTEFSESKEHQLARHVNGV